jgi:hypothetical protein
LHLQMLFLFTFDSPCQLGKFRFPGSPLQIIGR